MEEKKNWISAPPTPDWKPLVEHAKTAFESAYAPYSNFRVGCAVELEDGIVVKGANQENASYPLSMCAERVAIFAAKTQYPHKAISKIVIAVDGHSSLRPIAPCGACRQVIFETQARQTLPIQLLCGNKEVGFYFFEKADDLLPNAFGPVDLGRSPK